MLPNRYETELICYALQDQGFEIDMDDGVWSAKKQKALDEYKEMRNRQVDDGAIKIPPLEISKKSLDLIVNFETGGEAYYDKFLRKPSWPHGSSGVTIGVGFDLGYYTKLEIESAWAPFVDREGLKYLTSCSGITGTSASSKSGEGRSKVSIPWENAMEVFQKSTLPKFAGLAARAFPGLSDLDPDIQGAMLSIVFNRGNKLTGATRAEMMNIRNHIVAGRLDLVPGEIRSMKRLWAGKGLDGLLKRRDAEADMVEAALG